MVKTPRRLSRKWLIGLCAGFALTAQAQENGLSFLLNPESALTGTASREVALAPRVDGTALSFAEPQILIHKDTAQAEFISAVWKDAAGLPLHQRDVFFVKPDYGVIVDYLYGKGTHSIVRGWTPAHYRMQPIDLPVAAAPRSTDGARVDFSSTVNAPAPIPTVFLASTAAAAPKVEPIKPNNPMIVKFKVTYPDGRVDQVALGWEARPLHLSGREFTGWAAVLRESPKATTSIEVN